MNLDEYGLPVVPKGWEVKPFRRVFSESSEVNGPTPHGPMLSVSSYRGIEVKDYSHDSQRRTDGMVENYRVVRPGQLVVNTMWLNYGGLGMSSLDGHVSPAYRAYSVTHHQSLRFLNYLLRSTAYIALYTKFLTGIRPNSLQMSRDELMKVPVLLPPLAEQECIADYLDRETATIDALIEKQNALLLLLRERRSQLPTRVLSEVAGTRMQLRHVVADITDCPHWTPEQADSFDYAAVRSGSIRNGMYRHSASVPVDRETFIARHGAKVVPGNVLFAREAPAGEACLVPDDFQLCLGQRTVLIECDSKKLLPELVVANIYTRGVQDYFANASFGSTVANVRLPVLRATRVIVPPLNEQREIADHLDRETAKIDALIAKAERFIELAQERRAALITAAVTGQIETPTED